MKRITHNEPWGKMHCRHTDEAHTHSYLSHAQSTAIVGVWSRRVNMLVTGVGTGIASQLAPLLFIPYLCIF